MKKSKKKLLQGLALDVPAELQLRYGQGLTAGPASLHPLTEDAAPIPPPRTGRVDISGETVRVDGAVVPLLQFQQHITGEPHMRGLTLDHRLGVQLPEEYIPQVVWFVAQALALGAGLPCFSARLVPGVQVRPP